MATRNLIGRQVRSIRLADAQGMTQEVLAARLQTLGWDVDRFIVSKIERQQRQVTDREVYLLARALRVSIDCLFPKDLADL